MSAVVQATCPGCKKTLRVPAGWVNQSIRCKHCGTILQAKAQTSADVPKPASQPRPSVPTIAPSTPDHIAQAPAADPSPFSVLAEAAAAPVGRTHAGWRRQRLLPWLLIGFFGLALAVGAGVLITGLRMGWFAVLGPQASPRVSQKDSEEERPLPASGFALFPRRALVISVNNYLYANPVNFGIPQHSVHALAEKLSTGLRIPKDQVAELSDAAPGGMAKPPTKPVIEKTITDYLAGSRPQDRIMLLFVGHAAEVEGDVYLAPIDGELDNKDTLIPLKWLYEQLSDCPARQKVLVLDVARFNPGRGQERPGGGPMTAKIDAALKEPPEGVQVWSACVADQSSYEFDNSVTNTGMFVEGLLEVFNKGLGGVIQKPGDPFPLEALEKAANRYLKVELDQLQKVQTSRITGKEPAEGAAYDPKDKPPPKLVIAPPTLPDGASADPRLVRAVLKEIDVPSVKAARDDMQLKPESLPPFSANTMERYQADSKKTPLRDAVAMAKAALQKQGDKERLQEYFAAPANMMALHKELEDKGKQLAKAMFELSEALDAMTTDEMEAQREKESPRWQANYDYLLARLKAQLAYLNEYSALLGQMRKDQQPPLQPKIHSGWRVASQSTVSDATAKKLANESKKTLQKLMKEHPDTPWAILAKRDHLTNLGLEWQPTK